MPVGLCDFLDIADPLFLTGCFPCLGAFIRFGFGLIYFLPLVSFSLILIIIWRATLKLYLRFNNCHILSPAGQQVIFPRKPRASPALSSYNKKRISMLSQPLVFPCTALTAFGFSCRHGQVPEKYVTETGRGWQKDGK